MQKAIFIDKDDTLIGDIPYNVNPDLVFLTGGAGEFLHYFQNRGYKIIVITNQSGIAQGYFKEKDLIPVFKKINELVKFFDTKIDAFYYCPHYPGGRIKAYKKDCNCRKPKPGMILKAAKDFNINLKESWMIGDITADIEAGRRAGVNTILFNYYPNKDKEALLSRSDFMARNFDNAKRIIKSRQIEVINPDQKPVGFSPGMKTSYPLRDASLSAPGGATAFKT